MLKAAKRIKEYTGVISLQGRNMSDAMLWNLPWGSIQNSKAYLVLSSTSPSDITRHFPFGNITSSTRGARGQGEG